jgi:hypothetical protein
MGQQLQHWRSGGGEKLWLSMLIDTMEEVSRPAAPYSHQGSGFGLRH